MESEVRAYEKDGRTVVIYRPDEEIQNKYFDGFNLGWCNIGPIPEEVRAAGQDAMQSWISEAVHLDLEVRLRHHIHGPALQFAPIRLTGANIAGQLESGDDDFDD